MALFVYPPVQINTSGLATEANQLLMIAELEDVNSELDSQTTALTSITTELTDVNTELDLHTTALSDVNSELDSQTTALTSITTELTDVNTELDLHTTALESLNDKSAADLVPDAHDSIALTYVASGNGVGQVETVVYGLAGMTVATLTITYDTENRVSSVTRS